MRPPLRSGGNLLGGGARSSAALSILAALVAIVLSGLAIAALWTVDLSRALGPRLAGDATVAIWGRGLESADAAAARAAEILSAERGMRAAVLEPDGSDSWVGVMIGGRKAGSDGPRLVSVDRTSSAISLSGSIGRVASAGIDAAADDHRGAKGPLEQRAVFAATVASFTTVILCGGVFLAAAIAGRGTVARHGERIALMVRFGARRGFLARLVGWRVGLTVATGAGLGVLVGEGVTLLAVRSDLAGALPTARPAFIDGAIALPLPLLLFLIAAVGAGLGAGGALKRAESFG